MSVRYRCVFALIMSLLLCFLMTAWVTWINLGWQDDYFRQWLRAFITAWPVAALVAFAFGPSAHRLTQRVLR